MEITALLPRVWLNARKRACIRAPVLLISARETFTFGRLRVSNRQYRGRESPLQRTTCTRGEGKPDICARNEVRIWSFPRIIQNEHFSEHFPEKA